MINLLPEKEKKQFKLHILNRQIIVSGLFSIGAILFLSIFMLIIYLTLFLTQSQIKQSNVLFSEAQELEERISQLNKELAGFINQRLEYLNQIEDKKIYWSEVLEQLTIITPDNVRLVLLETDKKEENKIKIGGNAKTRDDVLLFQKILEQEKQFIEIESPLSNFVKQKDVDFYFSFKIKNAN